MRDLTANSCDLLEDKHYPKYWKLGKYSLYVFRSYMILHLDLTVQEVSELPRPLSSDSGTILRRYVRRSDFDLAL